MNKIERDKDYIFKFVVSNYNARYKSINVNSIIKNLSCEKNNNLLYRSISILFKRLNILLVRETDISDYFDPKLYIRYDFLLCLGLKGLGKKDFEKLRDGYHPKLIGFTPSFGGRHNFRLVFGSFDESKMDFYDSLDIKRFKFILNKLNIKNYQPKWQIKKNGKILVSPNRMQGWYKDRFTIAKFMNMWLKIKKLTPLKFEISLHRKDHSLMKNNTQFGERIKNFLKNTNIKLLGEEEEKDFNDYYAIIADMTSAQFSAILYHTLPFNLEYDTSRCPMSDLVIKDISKLNPENLKDEDLKDRDKWIKKMMTGFLFEEEIHNGKFIYFIFKNYFAKPLL